MNKIELYQKRRSLLTNTYSRTFFVIPSGSKSNRSHSVKYRFKAASDFSYLCGLNIPDALLLIFKDKTYLLGKKNEDLIWGENSFSIDEDFLDSNNIEFESLDRFEEIVRNYNNQYDRIAISLDRDQKTETLLLSLLSYNRKVNGQTNHAISLCDSRTLVGVIRLIKDDHEIENLKEASLRSSRVHTKLMQQILIGKTERQISNWIDAHFLLEDMQWTAYETIVGSNERSTILHASATDRSIQNNDIILIDAGGEWNSYCSDITRVLPAGNFFSDQQRKIYQAVLTAQKITIENIKPGGTLLDIHNLTIMILIEQLVKLKLSENLVRQHINYLMPHSTSHWMGMDVHDPSPHVDDRGNAIRLSSGMCFTVEPGLYFRDRELFKEYYGIGVRIEDDVIVTANACEVLSSAPKEIAEIEELRMMAK